MENIKYTVAGVQQHKLMELGLDIKDASIITYIKDIIATGKLIKKKVDGEVYYWINTKKLIEYLPVLKISNSKVITRRYKNYEDLGLINRHIHKNPLMGTYIFIKPLENFYRLFEVTKTESSEEELRAEYEKLGLEYDPLEGTQKCPRENTRETNEINEEEAISRGNSKVPSVELKSTLGGTQKCPHNNPYKDTPYNNTKSESEENSDNSDMNKNKKVITELKVIKGMFKDEKFDKNFINFLTEFTIEEITVAYERSKSAKKNRAGYMRECLNNMPKGRTIPKTDIKISKNVVKEAETVIEKIPEDEIIRNFLEIEGATDPKELSTPIMKLLNQTLVNSGYQTI